MSERCTLCDINLAELKCKDVVNICDGRKLGRIVDVVLDCRFGKIKGIVLPGGRGFSLFKTPEDVFLPWKCILRIGDDVILAELQGRAHGGGGGGGKVHRRTAERFGEHYEEHRETGVIDDEVHPRVMKYITASAGEPAHGDEDGDDDGDDD